MADLETAAMAAPSAQASVATLNWAPFALVPRGEKSDPPRSIDTTDGVADRLRAAAFAEVQARDAFLWAADTFAETDPELRGAWRMLARAEQKHLDWLLVRLGELGFDIRARRVSDQLWVSLTSCKTAREFALYMASAEERGRKAGERFHASLQARDPVTAEIFRKIAEEEVEHIALARRFFPDEAPLAHA